ncbi:MAG TPA: twin-arginine translocase subunit TatC [Propionibacteriaceae bacterium]|nr:twin-arginine translocase subunit TatC [Propionibacteriaceae bacterium]
MSLTIKGRPIHFSLKWLKPPPVPPDGTMTLFEHLRELRYRLIVSALAIIAGMVVAWFFRYELLDILQRPYFQAIEALKAKHPDANTSLVNINLTSPLTLSLKVAALAGAIVTAPFWLYQLWAFVVPGLLAKEKKWALIFIAAATPMFVGGVVVAYFVLPKAITVLLSFTQSGVTNLQDINAYLSFLLRLMLVFGLGFLIPLIVLMLNIVGVIKAKQMAKYRSLVIFGTFVFGAVATPSTDPFSMLAVAAPMALLFLGAEVIAHILDRRKERQAALAGDDLIVRHTVSDDNALRELTEDPGDEPEPSR